MWKGEVVNIFIRPEESQPTQEISQVHAVPGKGLEGDYFFHRKIDKSPDTGWEITLIEIEAIQAVNRDDDIPLRPDESRRNILTRGIPLNHLVGKEFMVGEVTLLGIRLCEPCSHLAGLTQSKVLPALIHRGGLRAKLLTEGIIRRGDSVLLVERAYEKEVSDAKST